MARGDALDTHCDRGNGAFLLMLGYDQGSPSIRRSLAVQWISFCRTLLAFAERALAKMDCSRVAGFICTGERNTCAGLSLPDPLCDHGGALARPRRPSLVFYLGGAFSLRSAGRLLAVLELHPWIKLYGLAPLYVVSRVGSASGDPSHRVRALLPLVFV